MAIANEKHDKATNETPAYVRKESSDSDCDIAVILIAAVLIHNVIMFIARESGSTCESGRATLVRSAGVRSITTAAQDTFAIKKSAGGSEPKSKELKYWLSEFHQIAVFIQNTARITRHMCIEPRT